MDSETMIGVGIVVWIITLIIIWFFVKSACESAIKDNIRPEYLINGRVAASGPSCNVRLKTSRVNAVGKPEYGYFSVKVGDKTFELGCDIYRTVYVSAGTQTVTATYRDKNRTPIAEIRREFTIAENYQIDVIYDLGSRYLTVDINNN